MPLPPLSYQTSLNILSPICYVMCESSKDTVYNFIHAILNNIHNEDTRELETKLLEFVEYEYKHTGNTSASAGSVSCRLQTYW